MQDEQLLSYFMTNIVDLKMASWNLKGLNHVIKKKKVLTYLKSSKVDIAFVQETHLNKTESLKLKCSWVGKSVPQSRNW